MSEREIMSKNERMMFETAPESSLGDRKALIRQIPLIIAFLEREHGLDLDRETDKFARSFKEYAEKKAKTEKEKQDALKKLEVTREKQSFDLFFKHFVPIVDNEQVDWNFRFKTQEFETVTLKESMQERVNVVASSLALTDPIQYLNTLEKDVDRVNFLIRRKDGSFYDSPQFQVKRVK